MSLKNIYFVGNWKMNGSFNSIEFLKKLVFFAKKNRKNRNFKIVLCIPSLLISYFRFFLKKPIIDLGVQNCSNVKKDYGPFTRQPKDTRPTAPPSQGFGNPPKDDKFLSKPVVED